MGQLLVSGVNVSDCFKREIQGHGKKNNHTQDAGWRTSITSTRRCCDFSKFRIPVLISLIPTCFFLNLRIALIILEKSNLYSCV